MALHLHRSNRTEALTGRLCEVLEQIRPVDPFEVVPIVVGSRGMERWLRHEIATRADIAAGLAFPFPRQALDGTARWLLSGDLVRRGPFWEPDHAERPHAARWEKAELAFRVLGVLRERTEEATFRPVRAYLEEVESAGVCVSGREVLFAREVAEVLDRLMHERPETALAWARGPDDAPAEHRWLAVLLEALGAGADPWSPCLLHRELVSRPGRLTDRALCVFGLSTMGAGERDRIAAIGRSIDVHLFVLVPSAPTGGARPEHPLLRALGGPSRDLEAWLEADAFVDGGLAPEVPDGRDRTGMLHLLQRELLLDRASGDAWGRDDTVGLHATWGALRQCEVLREQLLGLFAADPELEPRDVLVMTPDIETYAPLVAAVFARSGLAAGPVSRLPKIPVAVADLGLRRTNPVAEVLLQVLELAGERLTASRLVDLLSLEPVRDRWTLGDDDVSELLSLLREAGLRWGSDSADRAAWSQPETDQNTVRFAVERLALGVLTPDEDPLGVIVATPGGLAPAVPLELPGADRARRAGQAAGVLRATVAHRAALEGPLPLAAWRERLVSALDDLAEPGEEGSWLRAEVDQALDELVRAGRGLGDLEVDRLAVLRWLQGGFELPLRGDRPITGAVQVCALEPMRSVPFRVVALLGMDDGLFPRGSRQRSWDPMSTRRPGERDRREIDRHLLLEAILSAREHLLVLWSGHDLQQGRERPAATPVEELIEHLARRTGRGRRELVRRHPLQPWSSASFEGPGASFDHGMAEASTLLRRVARGDVEPGRVGLTGERRPLPAEPIGRERLELDRLAAGLLEPHRMLLEDRLGLPMARTEAPLEDREPLDLDGLEAWALRARVVDHLLTHPEDVDDARLLEALEQRLAGEGLLPLRAGGRALLAAEVARARDVLANLADIAGQPSGPVEIALQLEGAPLLIGRVERVVSRDDRSLLQWHTPSARANDRARLGAWLHLLAARASGARVEGARLVGHRARADGRGAGGDFLAFRGEREEAAALLADLVDVWRAARSAAVPLFRRTSATAAAALHRLYDSLDRPGARLRVAGAVTAGWSGGFDAVGDREDPWIRTFFIDYDPLDHLDDGGDLDLLGLSRRVWLPLVRGLAAGRALRAPWKRRTR